MYKRTLAVILIIMISALTITGCASLTDNSGTGQGSGREDDIAQNEEEAVPNFIVTEVGSYDSADTAVVISVDSENGLVTLLNIAIGRQYTLSYDGTTYVKNKYEEPMSMSQIRAGDIVDVTFLKSRKKLASLQISPRSWVYNDVGNYNLGGINKTATIGSTTYSLPDYVVVLSDGERKEVMDVVNKDVLTISGIDHTICSIRVEKGHGYLRLSNDQALIGGWIEIGSTVVAQITENMLLTVPEGTYQVLLSNGSASCTKDVIVERDREVILNVGDLEIVKDKVGRILFSVEPNDAEMRIDGEKADISKEVELPYGIHRVQLKAEGYTSMTKYIQVGSEYASLSFTMEEESEESENSSDNNDSSENVENAVTGNRVYIDAPRGVEAYMDGSYIGILPVNFAKVTGGHTISLRKSGYQSKSYTIYLYDDGEDITYSFVDLEPDNTTQGNNNTQAGNTSSTATTTSSASSTTTSSTSSNETVSGN
ncbi:MAG: PEGA domain-containing protein [Clostridiales bacterium]|nr:PEGA domain-containing protein [Clostridiales bacterium]